MKKIFIVIIVLIAVVVAAYYYFVPKDEALPEATPTASPTATPTPTPQASPVALGYVDVSPQEAKNLIDTKPNLIVIDVSPNYAAGHLPRAISYYVGDGSLDRAIPSLDKNAEYLVYCHIDSAAIAGAQKLVDAGFRNVYRLEGNYAAWIAAGYPVEK